MFFSIFFTLSLFSFKINAFGATVTDTLSFYVGYFGGPYYEKAVFNWKELYDNLSLHEESYSYTNGERVAVMGARGFYLRELFDYAGIDIMSIASMDFYTADQKTGAFASFTKESLLDTPRYYFDELAYKMKYDSDSLWSGANEVEPMLAIEDNWSWFNPGVENTAANFSAMSTSNRFRLCFGQTNPQEASTNKSAKMVHSVYVTFFGSPEINAHKKELELTVGSEYKLKLDIDAADELIRDEIRNKIVWQSDNNSIAEVDENGNITLLSEGEVKISANAGDMKAVYNITVIADTDTSSDVSSDTLSDSSSEVSDDTLTHIGTLSGNDNVSGNNLNEGNNDNPSTDTVQNSITFTSDDSQNTNDENDTDSRISDSLSEENIQPSDTDEGKAVTSSIETEQKTTEIISADKLIYKLDPGVISKDIFKESETKISNNNDIAPMVIPTDENVYLPVTAASLTLIFALGFLWGMIKYKKEI